MTLNKFQGKYKVRDGSIVEVSIESEGSQSGSICFDDNGLAKSKKNSNLYPKWDLMELIRPGEGS